MSSAQSAGRSISISVLSHLRFSFFSHLRLHLDQVVKVADPPGADDALDVVWEAGVVCLVVDILNLEELVAD